MLGYFLAGGQSQLAGPKQQLPWTFAMAEGRDPAPNQEEQWLQSFFDETLAAYMV
jgi:hypothetical protein